MDIAVTEDVLCLQGSGREVEPVLLSGNVVLYLSEDTDIKDITLNFRGKAKLPSSDSWVSKLSVCGLECLMIPRLHLTAPRSFSIYEHDWSFLQGERTHSHTLKAGRHNFPFQLPVRGHLPSSISTSEFEGANISYKLHSVAHRPGLTRDLHAYLPITIIRSFTPDSLEYQQSAEIENTWPGKLMYNILLPHKAWAIGDTLTALAKFVPTSKGVKVYSITSTISETVKLSPKNVHRADALEYTRPVVVTEHDVIGGRLVSPVHVHGSSQESPAEQSTQAGSSVCDGGEGDDVQNDDLVARLDITLPSSLTPTHNMEPIRVTHRIRFNISIANLDRHTSQLRCTLPIHVLDKRVLPEARAASLPTRRALLGMYGDQEEEMEDAQLPSYNAHLRDTVPTTDQPYSVPSGTRTPSSGLQSPSLRAHSDMTNEPLLDRITAALLRYNLSNNSGGGEDRSPPISRLASRLPSRAPSPERGPRSTATHSHENRGIFRKPFSAITSSFSHSHRTHSYQSITALSQPRTPDITETQNGQRSAPSSPRVSTHNMLYRFDDVPNYETASRGFAGGGVPPLTSMRGLPTYEEASTHPLTPDSMTPPSPDA